MEQGMCRVLTRLFLSILLLQFVVAVYAGTNNHQTTQKKRPNILLIVVDDLGYTDFSIYGSGIDTPNIDSLAKQGLNFSNFHVSVSCSPTRSMLLTGTDNHIAGLGNMSELLTERQRGKPGYEGYLNNRVISLAEVLKLNGYHTYIAGKWHLGHKKGHLPYDRGFEQSFSLLYGGASHWADMTGLMAKETPAKYSLNGKIIKKLPDDFYSTRSYSDFLMEAIRSNCGSGKPFFAYLALTSPHDPLHVPEPWLSKYRGKYDDGYETLRMQRIQAAKHLGLIPKNAKLPQNISMQKSWATLSQSEKQVERRKMEVYAGMIDNLDYHVGRVIKFLKDIGEYNNTLIIIMSDNGPNPWTTADYPDNRSSQFLKEFNNSLHNIGHPGSAAAYGMGWALAGSGPLSYFKMVVAEGGIRSPLIILGPGIKSKQKMIRNFIYVTDIMPTILDYLNISSTLTKTDPVLLIKSDPLQIKKTFPSVGC